MGFLRLLGRPSQWTRLGPLNLPLTVLLVLCANQTQAVTTPFIEPLSTFLPAHKERDSSVYAYQVLHEPVLDIWQHAESTGHVPKGGDVTVRLSPRARAVLTRPSWHGKRSRTKGTDLERRKSSLPSCTERDEQVEESAEQHSQHSNVHTLQTHCPRYNADFTLIPGDMWSGQGGSHAIASENEGRDNEWLVEVGYGTPPQKLKVVLDSGSAGGWLYSPQCCFQDNHTYFDPNLSSTYANRTLGSDGVARRGPASVSTPGTLWNTTYGSAQSKTFGYVGYDTLQLSPSLRVTDVNLALATSLQGGSRVYREMEGIVGLLPSSVIATKFPGGWNTPFEKAIEDHLLIKPYLSIALRKANRRTGRGGGGQYLFGEVDETARRGPLIWNPVKSQTFWGINFQSISMGRRRDHDQDASDSEAPRSFRNLTDPDDVRRRVIFDTGTALILLSSRAADAVNSQIYGSYKRVAQTQVSMDDSGESGSSNNDGSDGGDSIDTANPWLIPCDTGLPEYESRLPEDVRTPDFFIELGGEQFAVPSQDFAFWPLQPWPTSLTGGKQGMCLSAFQPSSAEYSILGGVFLKNVLVVLDDGDGSTKTPHGRRVGLATRMDLSHPRNANER